MWRAPRESTSESDTMRGMNVVGETTWRGRVDAVLARRRDTWTVAAALGAAVLVALVLWGRGATARIAPPATAPPVGSYIASAASPTAVVFVDVAGAVRRPGLYSLAVGARVADALAAAGGARSRADVSSLNLAQVLADGTKVLVPRRGAHATGTSAEPAPAAQPSGPPLVSLNAADQIALETIPGVGPVTAGAILEFRAREGPFESMDQLLEVDGIGPATLEQIRPYVTL